MYEHILFDQSDGVATITLNRPEVLNAYIPAMGEEVVNALAKVRDDDAVRAVILTGTGRGFCAGVDLEFMKKNPPGPDSKIGSEDFIRKMPLDLAEFPKPVIVAMNGHAIGVGVTMALPCDIRIAAEGIKIGATFTKLGILPGLGSTHLLPKIVGLAKALELVCTARVIRAEEALEIGLVNKVVPADKLMDEAREMASLIAACNPAAVAIAKRALHFGANSTLAEAMQNEQAMGEELRAKNPRQFS
ncbi:MAG: enoyl-CoA hydratase/isomerase family protein [Myxococcales bacterium]|nr:enoyl-CoA hydratase/isomerase family protein [Myxococcales bacterium]